MYLTGSRVVLALRDGPHRDVMAMRFPGADPQSVASERRLPGVSNYLVGANPRQWQTRVPQFGAIRYRRLYEGIDLVMHGPAAAGSSTTSRSRQAAIRDGSGSRSMAHARSRSGLTGHS
jgi:hypothetical protein